MQVIDILRDDRHIKVLFQLCHQFMTMTGSHQWQLTTTFIVEVEH